MTQRIEPFISWLWRKELNFFLVYDAKNWTLFQIWREELDLFFSNRTQRNVFFFFKKWLKALNFFFWVLEWNFFFTVRVKELNFFEYDSQNWTFFFFEYDSQNWTFFTMTQRIELFLFGYDSKIELFFWYGSKNWTSSFIKKDHDSKKWTRSVCFFQTKIMTQRIQPFCFSKKKKTYFHDSKNWTLNLFFLKKKKTT